MCPHMCTCAHTFMCLCMCACVCCKFESVAQSKERSPLSVALYYTHNYLSHNKSCTLFSLPSTWVSHSLNWCPCMNSHFLSVHGETQRKTGSQHSAESWTGSQKAEGLGSRADLELVFFLQNWRAWITYSSHPQLTVLLCRHSSMALYTCVKHVLMELRKCFVMALSETQWWPDCSQNMVPAELKTVKMLFFWIISKDSSFEERRVGLFKTYIFCGFCVGVLWKTWHNHKDGFNFPREFTLWETAPILTGFLNSSKDTQRRVSCDRIEFRW